MEWFPWLLWLHISGAIVAFGERHGVDAPLNRALTALVKGVEEARA